MLKDRYSRAFDAIAPDGALKARVKGKVLDMANHTVAKRVNALLVAALIVLLIAAGTGFATGWFRSVFSGMKDKPDNRADYEALETLAAQNVSSADWSFENGDGATLTVTESYYDGEQLIAGFICRANRAAASFDFGPGSAAYAKLKATDAVELSSGKLLTAEEYAKFNETLKNTGAAGAIAHIYYQGDGASLNGVYTSPEYSEMGEYEDGAQWRYIEFQTPLPEGSRNKDSIELTAILYRVQVYIYADASGVRCYYDNENRQEYKLQATIHRSEAEIMNYEAFAETENYAARVQLAVSPVNARAAIVSEICEEWRKAEYDEYGGRDGIDFVWRWQLFIDGVEQPNWLDTSSRYGASGVFAVTEGAQAITFRPVYVITGPRAEEDIVIRVR